jgi:hypothetical protein
MALFWKPRLWLWKKRYKIWYFELYCLVIQSVHNDPRAESHGRSSVFKCTCPEGGQISHRKVVVGVINRAWFGCRRFFDNLFIYQGFEEGSLGVGPIVIL